MGLNVPGLVSFSSVDSPPVMTDFFRGRSELLCSILKWAEWDLVFDTGKLLSDWSIRVTEVQENFFCVICSFFFLLHLLSTRIWIPPSELCPAGKIL